jgi:hypothetical protein
MRQQAMGIEPKMNSFWGKQLQLTIHLEFRRRSHLATINVHANQSANAWFHNPVPVRLHVQYVFLDRFLCVSGF